ncbi:MAG: hypothetical protein JHC33_14410 [Ignisphaera sp.]|nr:hypothetical protein [Ignisphaera sp.]
MVEPITLATLAEATPQQVFDYVTTHLITQGSRSVEGGTLCVYKHDNGFRCAAGCLMSTPEYTELTLKGEVEGQTWEDLVMAGLVPDAHSELISHLQDTHDNWGMRSTKPHLSSITFKLGKVANAFDLDSSIIQKTLEDLE